MKYSQAKKRILEARAAGFDKGRTGDQNYVIRFRFAMDGRQDRFYLSNLQMMLGNFALKDLVEDHIEGMKRKYGINTSILVLKSLRQLQKENNGLSLKQIEKEIERQMVVEKEFEYLKYKKSDAKDIPNESLIELFGDETIGEEHGLSEVEGRADELKREIIRRMNHEE